jgi:hypothetical protein
VRFKAYFLDIAATPLSVLTGTGFILLASNRLSFALMAAGALWWVYILTTLISRYAGKIMPKTGGHITLIFLSAFLGSVYFFTVYMLNPFLGMESFLCIMLSPVLYAGSFFQQPDEDAEAAVRDALPRAFAEVLRLTCVIIALSLIREPLGFATLSLPGGPEGIIELFNKSAAFPFPVQIVAAIPGALILWGYAVALFRRFAPGLEKQEPVKKQEEKEETP